MNAAEVDFELLAEALPEVQEHLEELEHDLQQLLQFPDSIDRLASAFRHMHSIKGDFAYCHATPIVEFVHALEGALQSMRSRSFQSSPLVCEALLQSIDQIHGMQQTLLQTRQYDDISRVALIELITQLGQARSQPDADQAARLVLLALHGALVAEPQPIADVVPPSADSIARALAQGELLADALARRQPGWRERTALQLRLVEALNRQYPRPSDVASLRIAVLWHDVGLLAVSDRLLHTPPLPHSVAWSEYAQHPQRAADWLLAIAPDCLEAAQIVRQHHQWANGKGGILSRDDPQPPHQGAQMLACADWWFERVNGRQGEEFRRAMLRTLFDVNSGLDIQFDALLINAFVAAARDFRL